MAWVPKAEAALTDVQKRLAEVRAAERAAAALPPKRWSVRLSGLVVDLADRKGALRRAEAGLLADLSASRLYTRTYKDLMDARRQLATLSQARGSIAGLPAGSRLDTKTVTRALDVQIGKLAKQVRTLERAELTWRAAVERAGRRPPRTPPKDIAVVIARTLEAAKGTSPAQMKG